MAYTVQIGQRTFHGLRGNVHIHTTDSDGNLTHAEVAKAAGAAGLDFAIVTDHNTYRPGLDGWVGNTLLLVGEEVHDPKRGQQSSHTLCFGIGQDVAANAADPQKLIDAVTAQGGFCFLAHPFEHDAARFLPEPNISWRDWEVTGYAGIELWNYMSEFKGTIRNRALAVLYAYRPSLAIVGPYPETLHKWDDLLRRRRVAVLGGSDAHGAVYRMGRLSRVVQPYEHLFRCVNTHLLSEEPLTGQVEHDRAAVYRALGEGHGFVGYEKPGDPAGMAFWARSGSAEATAGEAIEMENALELRVRVPAPATLRLLRDGRAVAQTRGTELALMTPKPGAYRVEAYRRYAGRMRGWIWSNPIYAR